MNFQLKSRDNTRSEAAEDKRLIGSIDIHPADELPNRLEIERISTRFLHVNETRMERLYLELTRQQQNFVTLLPICFHFNKAGLPGFSGKEAPAIISNYTPSITALQLAKRYSKNISAREIGQTKALIRSIFIMGSAGSLGFNTHSDLDIWLAVDSSLDHDARDLLQKKCDLLEKWGEKFNLDVHIYIVDQESFLNENQAVGIKNDNCGTTQQTLLLDEFYRSGIYLAGAYPTWWFIHPELEESGEEYITKLLETKALKEDVVFDFGQIKELELKELISSTVWQLYKSVSSPFKSLMKLMLIEHYASSYPKQQLLCTDYKIAIYNGNYSDWHIDSYLLIYQRIETYLLHKNDASRLEQLRESFYIKAGKRVWIEGFDGSASIDNTKPWQKRLLLTLLEKWDWHDDQIEHLNNRPHWTLREINAALSNANHELIRAYRSLNSFISRASKSEQMAPLSQQEKVDLALLGRRIYASYEPQPYKILYHYDTKRQASRGNLITLKHYVEDGQEHWAVFERNPDYQKLGIEPLPSYKANSYCETCCWSVLVGQTESAESIKVSSDSAVISAWIHQRAQTEVDNFIKKHLKDRGDDSTENRFKKPRRTEIVGVFINVEYGLIKSESKDSLITISNMNDALNYGSDKVNLIHDISTIEINSWGEVFCRLYKGEELISTFISSFKHIVATEQSLPAVDFFCIDTTHSEAIKRRLKGLLNSVEKWAYEDPSSSEPHNEIYVIEASHGMLCVDKDGENSTKIDSDSSLIETINQAGGIRHCFLDDNALIETPLGTVIRNHQQTVMYDNSYFVYYQLAQGKAEIYVVDPQDQLIKAVMTYDRSSSVLNSLSRFFSQYSLRQSARNNSAIDAPSARLAFFEIVKDNNSLDIVRRLPDENTGYSYTSIKAVGEAKEDGGLSWSFWVDDLCLKEQELKDNFYSAFLGKLDELRKSEKRYPIYFTDIEVAQEVDSSQTLVRDLALKSLLEKKINSML